MAPAKITVGTFPHKFGANFMKYLIALFLLVTTAAFAASPSYSNFDTNYFDTNTVTAGQVIIKLNTNALVSATSWLPGVGYEVWYEPFSGGQVSSTSATIGALGWSELADTGSIGVTNAANHWGIITLIITAAAGNKQTLYNSDCTNCRPTIPPLNATIAWTNRVIWRLLATNSIKGYLGFVGITGHNSLTNLQEGFGVYFNTTNTTQIMGMTALANTLSTTNLGNFVSGAWHTNIIWSTTPGVFSFSMDGGAQATLSTTIPTSGLTPQFGIIKTETTVISILEVDEWALWWKRL